MHSAVTAPQAQVSSYTQEIVNGYARERRAWLRAFLNGDTTIAVFHLRRMRRRARVLAALGVRP